MSTSTMIETWATENEQPADLVAAAMAAYHAGDPDAGEDVKILAAKRNIGCSGSGPEMFRRVRFPGTGSDGDEGQWPDANRLPALGIRASERRASVSTEVPVGTLVAEFSRDRFKGRGGKCSVSFALVGPRMADGRTKMLWLEHRTLRANPVYEISLPDGSKTTWARRT